MAKVKPGINIRTYERAQEVVDGIKDNGHNERYMRSVVSNVTGNGTYADNLSYRALQAEKHRILGVARKILKNREVGGDVSLECRVCSSPRSRDAGEQLYLFR